MKFGIVKEMPREAHNTDNQLIVCDGEKRDEDRGAQRPGRGKPDHTHSSQWWNPNENSDL